jgi:hypothetical protein
LEKFPDTVESINVKWPDTAPRPIPPPYSAVFPSPIVLWEIVQLSLPPMYLSPTPPPIALSLSGATVWLSVIVVSVMLFRLCPYLLEPISASKPPTPAPPYAA